MMLEDAQRAACPLMCAHTSNQLQANLLLVLGEHFTDLPEKALAFVGCIVVIVKLPCLGARVLTVSSRA